MTVGRQLRTRGSGAARLKYGDTGAVRWLCARFPRSPFAPVSCLQTDAVFVAAQQQSKPFTNRLQELEKLMMCYSVQRGSAAGALMWALAAVVDEKRAYAVGAEYGSLQRLVEEVQR